MKSEITHDGIRIWAKYRDGKTRYYPTRAAARAGRNEIVKPDLSRPTGEPVWAWETKNNEKNSYTAYVFPVIPAADPFLVIENRRPKILWEGTTLVSSRDCHCFEYDSPDDALSAARAHLLRFRCCETEAEARENAEAERIGRMRAKAERKRLRAKGQPIPSYLNRPMAQMDKTASR